ncbi:MAG TPA: hypothetical protein DCY41_03240 [Opitutae bacterium]|nr:hypothetical protein [Opitutae bacterium]
MKHTLPLLALVAAASAQTAPASGLNYDLVTISRHQRQNTVAVQGVVKDTNFLIGISTTNGNQTDYRYGQIDLGYIFKNVTNGIDATVGIIQVNGEATVYSLTLRRQWNEAYQGLEISAGYTGTLASDSTQDWIVAGTATCQAESASFVQLAYNYNKTLSFSVGLVKPDNNANDSDGDRATVFSVRAAY